MRPLSSALLLLLVCGVPVKAQVPNLEAGVEVGRGVICGTAEQVRKFVTLRSAGREPDAALTAVNQGAGDGAACNFGYVMFSDEERIAELSINGRPVAILRIVVHAFGNGSAWRRVPQTVQYTPMPEKGQMT
jgi:hypothetical protein